ncbi:MAG: peptidylprolyl isomerase [Campylobacterota bacterium]|nr:peptidylprolyl isomerase [Campylobacterota bacterium]
MITWMQHNKKYLIVTIWISTIAFIGAGFVGWGQYSYGDKSGSVAKVGEVEISIRQMQQAYGTLYSKYNQMFQGNFDSEKAKMFQLEKQAFTQLYNQALLENVAKNYNLTVSDKELVDALAKQKMFFKDGKFDVEIYKSILSQNNLTMSDYESDVRLSLLIQKVINLYKPKSTPLEVESITKALSIADKINYKILTSSDIKVDVDDAKLKKYHSERSAQFTLPPSYEVEVIEQLPLDVEFGDEEISEYYTANKQKFANENGVIRALEEAKSEVVKELRKLATKKAALKQYIGYKKSKLDESVKKEIVTISEISNPYGVEILEEVKKLTPTSPFMKPKSIDESFVTIKLISTNPSAQKSFEQAYNEVKAIYIEDMKDEKLQKLAENSVATFKGTTSDFITIETKDAIKSLNENENQEFVKALFTQKNRRGIIRLTKEKIVLYDIVEQNLLSDIQSQEEGALNMKTQMFDAGIIKLLEKKYPVQKYMEGI